MVIEAPTPVVRPARRSRRSGRVRRSRGVLSRILIPAAWLLAIFDVAVLAWMLLGSVKTTRDLAFHPFGWPQSFNWRNYVDAWNVGRFGEGILNSLILVIGAGVGCIIIAAPAAYALSRFRVRTAPAITVFFVMGLGIPAQTLFIPLYFALYHIGLVDSIWGLLIIYIGTGIPFALFLLTAFFGNLPAELEEAAAIDGATPWYTFWRIMLPLARSGLITIFVLQAIGHWGETFFALVMLQTKTTISLAMYNFLQTMQYTGARYSVLFAGLTMVILPLIAVYIWLGRRIIEGIAAGYSR